MMLFSKNIIRSFVDLPNHTSLIINTIGCNLHCYKCFNYKALVSDVNETETCDKMYILSQVKQNGYLSDAIILSGGEFLLNKSSDIAVFLEDLKAYYDGLIIVNTNGCFPEKMRKIRHLIDGFHTDMKLPYQYIDSEGDAEIIKLTLGEVVDVNKMAQSVEFTVESDSGYSQIRSVQYPFLDLDVFEDNKKYIAGLNNKYHKNTPYYANEFISI